MNRFVLPLILLAAIAEGQVPDITAYPDTAAAQQAWQPRFGSPPVRVEKLPDGTTAVVLEGEFKAPGDRLCWDWTGNLDLSQAEAVSMEVMARNAGLTGNFGVYFGTPGGWYARFGWGGTSDAWTRQTWQLADFGTEGEPAGWGKVNCFRFSVWGAIPGKITYYLRNLQVHPRDPHRNYLRNGSFEVPGPLPYGWASGHWGIGNLPWAADMELWRQHFALDKTVAHDGQCSLRVINGPDLPSMQAVSVWFGLRDTPATDYTLSAWLKADRDDLPVTLGCGDHNATVKVGKEWQRHSLTGIKPGPQLTARIGATGEGTLWIDGVQVQATGQDTDEFHPHPDDESLIQREAQVDWSPPPRTADVAKGQQTAGPLKPAKVEIDANGRCLVGGQAYLMHSLGLEFVSDLKMLDVVAAAGFPDVCIEVRAGIPTEELQSWFDRCAALGLHVIPWLNGDIPLERFRSHITTLRDHPALLCWYVYDEPSGERFAEADARLKLAHELDPNHPALINYLGNKLTGHMGDIYSTDIYPIPHSTPTAAINGVGAMAAAARPEHKPVWMWLQGTGYAYWMDREPTPRELSCMVYGSLIAGARGIYYFAQVPRTQECWAEMRALCVELSRLAPVLGSLDPAPAVQCDDAAVMAGSYANAGETYVLAANTRSEPCEATVTIPTKATAAEVVFEGRRLKVSGGKWRDGFGAYERHVYRLAQP